MSITSRSCIKWEWATNHPFLKSWAQRGRTSWSTAWRVNRSGAGPLVSCWTTLLSRYKLPLTHTASYFLQLIHRVTHTKEMRRWFPVPNLYTMPNFHTMPNFQSVTQIRSTSTNMLHTWENMKAYADTTELSLWALNTNNQWFILVMHQNLATKYG